MEYIDYTTYQWVDGHQVVRIAYRNENGETVYRHIHEPEGWADAE